MTATWPEPPLCTYEIEVDVYDKLDPAERHRRAVELLAQRTAEAAEELAALPDEKTISADDWSWSGCLAKVQAAAPTAPPVLITTARGLVDLLIEACAQADVRDCDVAKFCDLPTLALRSVAESWAHAEERCRE